MHLGIFYTAGPASSLVFKYHGFRFTHQSISRQFVQVCAKSTSAALHPRTPHLDQSSTMSSSTSASSASASTSKPDPSVLGPLPRPLGVSTPPSSEPETWSKMREKLLDKDRHMAKRRSLLKQVNQGYFHDHHLIRRRFGGKQWTAPSMLIREDMALYFPNIGGRDLHGEKTNTTKLFTGRTTVLSITNTRLSEEHTQSFVRPVLEDQKGKPGFSFVQINHQANLLKSMLVSLFTSSLRRAIPETRWGTYMLARGEWSEVDVCEPLGIENKIIGFVFLIDASCKVRWAGCGQANEKEVQALRQGTEVLMNRMKVARGSDQGDPTAIEGAN
ncbi:MAG: Mitochondrial ATPase complex subunit atp10 [Tremellales sp. Tagirdzhanova-0007]|nr:MAG: Mitochondrial ATPase complex subunit atp10 [Tremellales sp. Tagirdzhanova-0007]